MCLSYVCSFVDFVRSSLAYLPSVCSFVGRGIMCMPKSTKVKTLAELRMRGTAKIDGRLLVVSRWDFVTIV